MSRADDPISSIMQHEFVTLAATDHLDLADDVMRLGRIRHMPVVEGERLVGIVSQRDLLSASLSKVLDFDPSHRRSFMRSIQVSEAMTRDVLTVPPETPIKEVARLMIRHKIGCVPVAGEDGRPVGVVTEVDLLRSIYDTDD